MRDQGIAILLVEQRKDAVLAIADRVVFLENGRIIDRMDIEVLHNDAEP